MGAPKQVLRMLLLNNQFQKKNKFFFCPWLGIIIHHFLRNPISIIKKLFQGQFKWVVVEAMRPRLPSIKQNKLPNIFTWFYCLTTSLSERSLPFMILNTCTCISGNQSIVFYFISYTCIWFIYLSVRMICFASISCLCWVCSDKMSQNS